MTQAIISTRAFVPPIFEAKPPAEPSLYQKITRVFFKIISYIIFPIAIARWIAHKMHVLAGHIILPAQGKVDPHWLAEGAKRLMVDFNAQEARLKTIDGTVLDAMYVAGNGSKNGKTAIFFTGNNTRYQFIGLNEGKQIQDFIDAGYNVLLFNYRGVGYSTGEATRDGLIQDGQTALEYVESLGVAKKDVLLYGLSLGGGVATQVAAKNEGVMLCSDRSFGSLKEAARVLLGPIFGNIAAFAILATRWDFDSISAWERVKGRKWMLYNPLDRIIIYGASAHKAILQKNPFEKRFTALANLGGNHHCRPLQSFEIRPVLMQFA